MFFFDVDRTQFLPHGQSVLWENHILLPMVLAELAIFLSFTIIPIGLFWFLKYRPGFTPQGKKTIWLFIVFAQLCGISHVVNAWNFWHTDYYLELVVKVMTAVVSVTTTYVFVRAVPVLVQLPSADEYGKLNDELVMLAEELEGRVKTRTEELQAREKELSTIVAGVTDAIVELQPEYAPTGQVEDFRMEPYNRIALQLLAENPGKIKTPRLLDYYPEADQEGFLGLLAEVLTTNESKTVDPVFIASQKRYFRFSATKISGRDSLMVFFNDVTDRENMKVQSLAQANLVSLGQLAGGIAHEINTPLQVIDGIMRRLRRRFTDHLTDADKDSFETVKQTVRRVSRIVYNLRQLARSDSSQGVPIDLGAILEDVYSVFEERLSLRGVDLEIRVELDPTFRVMGKEISLLQILTNLVNNAIDAVEGVDEPKIQLRAFLKDAAIVVEVNDNGPGVDPEIAGRIFEPLFTTKDVGKGTGLGLSLSQRMAQDMGGTLNFKQDEKTRFQIVFSPGKDPV